MTCLIWRKGSMLARLKLNSPVNRIIWNHFRLHFSNLVQFNKPVFTVQQQFLRGMEIPFSHINTSADKPKSITTSVEYEEISEETLQTIGDRFEELLEKSNLNDWDVNYSNDVLTVCLDKYGTYVLNKQSPNRQIWLSSPISGPKRYDYIEGIWIYKHDGNVLHQLLSDEMSRIVEKDVDFMNCAYSKNN